MNDQVLNPGKGSAGSSTKTTCWSVPASKEEIAGNQDSVWDISPDFQLTRTGGNQAGDGGWQNTSGTIEYSRDGGQTFGNWSQILGGGQQQTGIPIVLRNTVTGATVDVVFSSVSGGGSPNYSGVATLLSPERRFTVCDGVTYDDLGNESELPEGATQVPCKDLGDVIDAIAEAKNVIKTDERCYQRPASIVYTDNVIDQSGVPVEESIFIYPNRPATVESICIRVINNAQDPVGVPFVLNVDGTEYSFDQSTVGSGPLGPEDGNVPPGRYEIEVPIPGGLDTSSGEVTIVGVQPEGGGLNWTTGTDSDGSQTDPLSNGQYAQFVLKTGGVDCWSQCDFSDGTTITYGINGEVIDDLPVGARQVRCGKQSNQLLECLQDIKDEIGKTYSHEIKCDLVPNVVGESIFVANGGSADFNGTTDNVTINVRTSLGLDTVAANGSFTTPDGKLVEYPITDRYRISGGNFDHMMTFDPPVPANELAFVISDINANNPTVQVTLNGGTATTADFDVVQNATVTAVLVYDPATGQITRSSPGTGVREHGVLIGNSAALVETIQVQGQNISGGDATAYQIVAIDCAPIPTEYVEYTTECHGIPEVRNVTLESWQAGSKQGFVDYVIRGEPCPLAQDPISSLCEKQDLTNQLLQKLIDQGDGSDGGDGGDGSDGGNESEPFASNDDLNVTFFNEQQFSWGYGLQNTTNAAISNWSVQIANASYNLDETQLTNNGAFDLITTTNPDGTFTHTFVGLVDIPAFSGIPGGAIQWNGVNFGTTPTSEGIQTGTGGG